MLNLVYKSFPFGDSEIFAEYEIPYLNEIAGNQYRIFSLYNGKDDRSKRNVDILGQQYIVNPSKMDYVRGAFSLFCPSVINELSHMKNRECRDSLSKCLWRMLYYRAYGYALRRITQGIGINDNEVFVSYWLNECAYAAIMLKHSRNSIKVVSRAHGFDVFEERCYLPYRNELLSNLDAVFPINRIEKKYLLERYNESISEDKIHVAHLGINIPEQYSLNDSRGDFTIVSCSSIIHLKRLDLLVEALAEIEEFHFKWIHIGGGLLQEEIIGHAEEVLCHDNQSFEFLGQVPLAKVHDLYREYNASLFVNCSDTEGVPVSIMEAMSYGIPVVARDVGGNSEIVDNSNGLLLRTNCSAHELADAIRTIHSMGEEEYVGLRHGARSKVVTEFNADHQYRNFFEEVMEPLDQESLWRGSH